MHHTHLVLENDNVLQLHNLHSRQVLGGLHPQYSTTLSYLGLRAGLITSNKEESSIHDCGTVEHGGHQDIVTGTIDEGNVTLKTKSTSATLTRAGNVVLLVGAVGAVALGSRRCLRERRDDRT